MDVELVKEPTYQYESLYREVWRQNCAGNSKVGVVMGDINAKFYQSEPVWLPYAEMGKVSNSR